MIREAGSNGGSCQDIETLVIGTHTVHVILCAAVSMQFICTWPAESNSPIYHFLLIEIENMNKHNVLSTKFAINSSLPGV